MREIGRLPLALAVVALVTILGLAILAQLKFSAFLSDSIGERLAVVATTAEQDFGSAMDLGLSIDEIANGEQILERARSHDPSISGMAVFDLDGRVLHLVGDAPSEAVHAQTQEAFRIARLDDTEDEWTVEADGRLRRGVVIKSSFGQPVAGIVVHYPTIGMRDQEASMLRALLFDAAWIGLAVAAVIALAFVLMLRSGRRRGQPGPDRR